MPTEILNARVRWLAKEIPDVQSELHALRAEQRRRNRKAKAGAAMVTLDPA